MARLLKAPSLQADMVSTVYTNDDVQVCTKSTQFGIPVPYALCTGAVIVRELAGGCESLLSPCP